MEESPKRRAATAPALRVDRSLVSAWTSGRWWDKLQLHLPLTSDRKPTRSVQWSQARHCTLRVVFALSSDKPGVTGNSVDLPLSSRG